ncbi:hypothetical protein HYR99_36625 [Candidatus Poribacteria bacterium]|nr:hypothetical protein [Candidatus Poribacteria bacterium]
MSLFKYVRDLDPKFAWSFFGVVIALIFGAITIYMEFIQDPRPTLRYDILTSTSVLDVKEEVSNLSVLFDGVDIRKQGMSLRVITFRVINDSSKDILKGFYDDRAPLGISLSTGKIIKSELAGASNEYLIQNYLVLSTSDDRSLLFPSLIIEAGQSFTVKILVLHPKNETPTVKTLGKIAGISSIPVREAYKDDGKDSFLTTCFRGGFLTQMVRLLAYTVVMILLLVCTIFPFASTKLGKRKRRRMVDEFKGLTTLDLDDSDEQFFSQYVEGGSLFMLNLRGLIRKDTLDHFCRFLGSKRLLSEEQMIRRSIDHIL